jgi:dTDP-4-dehydrorhamnose reductase
LQLSKIIYEIINQNLYWKGVRHIFSPTTVSKHELCTMISDIYELNIKVKEYETEKVDKSLSTVYEVHRNIPELKDQLKEMRNFCF